MQYPDKHQQITKDLLEGKFITIGEQYFDILKENHNFYLEFFEHSFGFELKHTQEFYYLISDQTTENTSRDISIFFAIFCHELDKADKNFIDELNFSDFRLEDIINIIKNSSWDNVISANNRLKNAEGIRKLITSTMVKRNIVTKHSNQRYTFTKAHKFFIDFAKDLISSE